LPPPSLQISEKMQETAARCLRDLPGPHDRAPVILHPGSGSPRKCWPPDRFAALAHQLLEDHHRVVVLEGPADQQAQKALLARAPDLPVLRKQDLSTVAGILAIAAICVANDSGIGHLSAALGTPTVSVFGPTDPGVWRPLGNHTIAVGGEARNWPPVDRVYRAIRQMRPHSRT
jgi:ADP-heptose:LPS heptosyltransferase